MNNDKKEFVMSAKSVLHTEAGMPSIPVESGGEFVLPDYMPKVQKVLRIEANATPPSKYIGARDAQMSGSVLHTLIYLGEDGEVGATVLPSKYEFSVPLDSSDMSPAVVVTLEVDSVNYRLNGPRKLNIRTRLRAKPMIFSAEDVPDIENAMTDKVHKLYGEAESVNTCVTGQSDITVSDTVQTNKNKDSHLIWCGSTAAVSDIRVMDGGISVRGDVIVKIILSAEGVPEVYSKKIPFEEFISAEISHDAFAVCMARVISTEAAKNSEDEVMVDVTVALEAICDMPCTIPVLKDAFFEKCNDRAEYREVTALKHILSRSGVYNVSASAQSAGAQSVIDTSGKAVLDEIDSFSGKLIASGRCLINCICKNDDGTISASDFSLPFRIEQDCQADDIMAFADASLANVRTRVNGGNIEFDMDIALSTRVVKPEKHTVLSGFECDGEAPLQGNAYPLAIVFGNGESLWSIAKKYRVDPMSIAEANMLEISEGELDDPEKMAKARSLMLEFK